MKNLYKSIIASGFFFLIALALFLGIASCSSNNNVVQGQVTYVDDSSHQEIAAVGVNVLMYQSVVEYQDHPKNYDKIVTTGPSGYYSLFPLSDGPYYVYAEKLDTAGKVLFSAGSSVNVGGNETKLLNLFMH